MSLLCLSYHNLSTVVIYTAVDCHKYSCVTFGRTPKATQSIRNGAKDISRATAVETKQVTVKLNLITRIAGRSHSYTPYTVPYIHLYDNKTIKMFLFLYLIRIKQIEKTKCTVDGYHLWSTAVFVVWTKAVSRSPQSSVPFTITHIHTRRQRRRRQLTVWWTIATANWTQYLCTNGLSLFRQASAPRQR